MKSHATVEISRDRDTVFDYTTRNVAEWSQIVVLDEVIHDQDGGVGTTFRTVTEDRGKRMEFQGTVTGHEPPARHALTMIGQHFEMDVLYTFEPAGEQKTRVTQETTVRPKGFLKVIFLLMGWMMNRAGCSAAQKELNNLKALLEK